jgi:hypothetical protein
MDRATKVYLKWVLALLSVACVVVFLGCCGSPSPDEGGNQASAAQGEQATRQMSSGEQQMLSDETGGTDEIRESSGEGESEEEPEPEKFVPTQEQPLAPPAEPAAGSETAPADELVLAASLSGVEDPVALADGITVRVLNALNVQCTIVNNTQEPQEIGFATSQKLDVIFSDADGIEVLKWSDGRRFAQMFNVQTLAAGESWSHELTVTIGDGEYQLQPGVYNVTVLLTGEPELTSVASDVEIVRL